MGFPPLESRSTTLRLKLVSHKWFADNGENLWRIEVGKNVHSHHAARADSRLRVEYSRGSKEAVSIILGWAVRWRHSLPGNFLEGIIIQMTKCVIRCYLLEYWIQLQIIKAGLKVSVLCTKVDRKWNSALSKCLSGVHHLSKRTAESDSWDVTPTLIGWIPPFPEPWPHAAAVCEEWCHSHTAAEEIDQWLHYECQSQLEASQLPLLGLKLIKLFFQSSSIHLLLLDSHISTSRIIFVYHIFH